MSQSETGIRNPLSCVGSTLPPALEISRFCVSRFSESHVIPSARQRMGHTRVSLAHEESLRHSSFRHTSGQDSSSLALVGMTTSRGVDKKPDIFEISGFLPQRHCHSERASTDEIYLGFTRTRGIFASLLVRASPRPRFLLASARRNDNFTRSGTRNPISARYRIF